MKPLTSYSMEDLHDRRGAASAQIAKLLLDAGGKVSGAMAGPSLPDGVDTGEVVRTLKNLASVYLPTASRVADRLLSLPVFLLERPGRLSIRVGNTVLVRDAGRYDLVEVLAKVCCALRTRDIELVDPGVTFAEADHHHEWQGALFEFYFGTGLGGLKPTYVGHVRQTDWPVQTGQHGDVKVVKVSRR